MGDDLNTTEDWFFKSKEYLKFIDDGDLISSDSADESNNVESPKKYNQLNPRANLIYKLLNPIRQKVGYIWKSVTDSTDSDLLDSYISSNTMAKIKKSQKRKHEEMRMQDVSSDEGMTHDKKRAKKSSDELVNKKINRKIQNHSMSSSDSESSADKSRNKRGNKKIQGARVSLSPSSEGESSTERPRKERVKKKIHGAKVSLSSSDGESSAERRRKKRVNKKMQSARVKVSSKSHLLNSEIDSAAENTSPIKDSNSLYNRVDENDIPVTDGESIQEHDSSEGNEDSGIDKHEINNKSKQSLQKSHSNRLVESKTMEEGPKLSQEEEGEISKLSFLLNEDLIKKNNIWLLQCPKSMDCSMLTNQCINLNGRCELEDGTSTFEAYSYRNDQERTAILAVPTEQNHLQLCTIPLSGNIIVEECVKIKNKKNYNIPEPPKCVELPRYLQTRHPLLGTNYENQPRTIERVPQSPNKKKKDIKKEYVDELEEQEVPSSSHKITKKRKRKDSVGDSVDLGTHSVVEESHVKKKKKNKRHSDESYL